jgi:enoyl-CoA hydratase/carnithine racemase
MEYSIDGGIAVVTLNRPEKRNALSDAMRTEFIAALEKASADKAVRAVVVTGNGKSFCSGGDIQGMQQRLQAPAGEIAFNGWSRQKRTHHAVSLLHFMSKPTIAAVNGSSAGLGTDLALCCDFILASEEASFAWSYIHRGLVPDGGGLYFLPRRVGLSRAKELIFSGRRVDALALGKAILDTSFESDANDVFAQGSQAQSICYTTAEHHQAVADFLARTARKS